MAVVRGCPPRLKRNMSDLTTPPCIICRQHIQECLYPSPTIRYQLPWEQKTAWGVLFGAMLLIAISGNCIVLWIVLGECSPNWDIITISMIPRDFALMRALLIAFVDMYKGYIHKYI